MPPPARGAMPPADRGQNETALADSAFIPANGLKFAQAGAPGKKEFPVSAE